MERLSSGSHGEVSQMPKNSGKPMYGIIWGILQGYPISPDFGLKLCTVIFWEYPWNIPYPIKTEKKYAPEIFWDIPGISHIPKKLTKHMYQLFFGISLVYPISQKLAR